MKVKLSELYDIGSSKRVFQSEWRESGVPFYRAREIAKLSDDGFVDNELFIDEKLYSEYVEKYGKPESGDVMVTGVGTLGVCYVVKPKDRFYFKDGNILWFKQKAKDKILPEYLVKAFDSKEVKDFINKNSSGTTVGTFTIQTAKKMEISLPSLDEQKEIIDKVTRIELIIKQRKQELQLLDNLIKARFVEMFIGKDYSLITLDDLTLGKGEYGAQSAAIDYNSRRPRYVRITDINDDGTLNNDLVSSANVEDDEQYKLSYGDFMFARMGATVGKTYAYKSGNQIFAGYLIRYRLNLEKIIPEYLYVYTKLDEYRNWVLLNQSGAAQPGINAKKYCSLRIPVAPLEEQRVFADFVKQVDKSKVIDMINLLKILLFFKRGMYYGN